MRNRVVEDIMVYKEENDIPILQPEQEAKQREWLKKRMEGKRHTEEVAAVFDEITRNSKRIQARKLFDYNIVLIGFMGAGKVDHLRFSAHRICDGSRRNGSDHCRAAGHVDL